MLLLLLQQVSMKLNGDKVLCFHLLPKTKFTNSPIAQKGETGVGYEGNFEFIYFGKEGNKLKFKTQRKDTEQFVYFEPATAQDWNAIQTLSSNINTLENNIDSYYFTVSTTASATGYEMKYENRL